MMVVDDGVWRRWNTEDEEEEEDDDRKRGKNKFVRRSEMRGKNRVKRRITPNEAKESA